MMSITQNINFALCDGFSQITSHFVNMHVTSPTFFSSQFKHTQDTYEIPLHKSQAHILRACLNVIQNVFLP